MKGIIKAFQTADNQYMVSFNDAMYDEINAHIDFKDRKCYNIIPARILGISYAEYLRYARDKYNGIIVGKGQKYPHIVFEKESDCNLLCKELLLRWTRM